MRQACDNVRPLMKLLIRNLARTTTESELLALFSAFGHVQACDLVLDKASGLSKGFGFVEIPKAGEAKAAMKELNGKLVDGNKLRVKKVEPITKKRLETSR
jgi:RNA recognition motif-containing protein